MTMKFKRVAALACGLAPVVLPAAAHAQTAHQASGGESQNVEQRIDELKAMKKELLRMMRAYDARIQKLEAEVKARPARRRKSPRQNRRRRLRHPPNRNRSSWPTLRRMDR